MRWQVVRLLRLFGIDQLDEPGHAAGRGSVGHVAEDFDNHRRILNGGDDLQGAAAVGAVFDVDVDVEYPFEQPDPADARRAPCA